MKRLINCWPVLGLFAATLMGCSDNPNLPQQGTGNGELVMLNAFDPSIAPTLRIDGTPTALPAVGSGGTATLTAGTHEIQLATQGQLLASRTITIAAGTHRTAILSGTAAQPILLFNTIDTAVVPLLDAVKFRLVHTVPDAPATDAYAFLTTQAADSGARIIFPFTFGAGTDPSFPGYVVRPPGSYRVWLKRAGTDEVLLEGGPFALAGGDVYSFVLARNEGGALELRAIKEH